MVCVSLLRCKQQSAIICLFLFFITSSTFSRTYYPRPDRRSLQVDVDDLSESCSSPPSLQMHKFLDQICEDCYRLYRDVEIYHMCRADCFSSGYFKGCMDSIMVTGNTKHKAAKFISMINNFVK